MKKERKPESFLRKPSYKGGPAAMRKFIGENLRYPAGAKAQQIEGTVRLRMDISHQGKVIGTKILSSLGHGCDEEAERVVKLLKFEVPKLRKIRATFHKKINIHFRLPKAKDIKQPNAPTQVQYTMTAKKDSSSPNEEDDQRNNGYEYTINWWLAAGSFL